MGGILSTSPIDIDQWVREYQSALNLRGIKSKNQLRLKLINWEWSSLEYEEYWWHSYSINGNYGQCFSTEIGTEVTITSGGLKGFHPNLPLPLDVSFPRSLRQLVNDPVNVDLGNPHQRNTKRHKFTCPHEGQQLERNMRATFKCEVQLTGDVNYQSSSYSGRSRSFDQVDAGEMARDRGFSSPSWTVEGECIFHLGRNRSIIWY